MPLPLTCLFISRTCYRLLRQVCWRMSLPAVLSVSVSVFLLAHPAHATGSVIPPATDHTLHPSPCTQTRYTTTATAYAAPIRFGNVTFASAHLQPPGTLLASTVVPPTDFGYSVANANSILWKCDASVLSQLYYLVSTNGDSRYGGHNEIGQADGLSDVYGTWYKNVGLRQTVDGVPVSRYWRKVPLKNYEHLKEAGREMIVIRLKHVPALHAELYRVSAPVPLLGTSAACGGPQLDPTAQGVLYLCGMPNAYISLAGPGLIHDQVGEDANVHYLHWGHNNGFAYRMYRGTTLFRHASCAVRNTTAHVTFPSVARARMQAGGEVSARFSVQLVCDDAVVSGTRSGQASIGIQVSPGAWRAAQQLGLVNSDGGVRALVSDQYGRDAALAQGVGIRLQTDRGQPLLFAGQANSAHVNPVNAGWMPVLHEAQKLGASSAAGHSVYQRSFTAVLHHLPGHAVTTGRIQATAYIMVKVQ